MTAIYAIVQAPDHGWGSTDVLGFGALAAPDGRVPRAREPDRESDHAASHPPAAWSGPRASSADSWSPACTRRSSSARCTSSTSVTTRRFKPGRRSCPGRSPSRSSRAGVTPAPRGAASGSCAGPGGGRMTSAVVGAAAVQHRPVRRPRSSRRSVHGVLRRSALGLGMAFMPLLTIAMADVAAADAGLGPGSPT